MRLPSPRKPSRTTVISLASLLVAAAALFASLSLTALAGGGSSRDAVAKGVTKDPPNFTVSGTGEGSPVLSTKVRLPFRGRIQVDAVANFESTGGASFGGCTAFIDGARASESTTESNFYSPSYSVVGGNTEAAGRHKIQIKCIWEGGGSPMNFDQGSLNVTAVKR